MNAMTSNVQKRYYSTDLRNYKLRIFCPIFTTIYSLKLSIRNSIFQRIMISIGVEFKQIMTRISNKNQKSKRIISDKNKELFYFVLHVLLASRYSFCAWKIHAITNIIFQGNTCYHYIRPILFSHLLWGIWSCTNCQKILQKQPTYLQSQIKRQLYFIF